MRTVEKLIEYRLEVADIALGLAIRSKCPSSRGPGWMAEKAFSEAAELERLLKAGKRQEAVQFARLNGFECK